MQETAEVFIFYVVFSFFSLFEILPSESWEIAGSKSRKTKTPCTCVFARRLSDRRVSFASSVRGFLGLKICRGVLRVWVRLPLTGTQFLNATPKSRPNASVAVRLS